MRVSDKALQAMEEAPPNRGDRCRRAVLATVQWGESAPPPGGVPESPSRGWELGLGKGGPFLTVTPAADCRARRCRRHRLAAGHSAPGRRPGPWRPSRRGSMMGAG